MGWRKFNNVRADGCVRVGLVRADGCVRVRLVRAGWLCESQACVCGMVV